MSRAQRQALYLVFTDLDGSLLDHHSYSYQDARPQMYQLERLGIPLLPATSKTRAELESFRAEIDSSEPFIVENGAAVFVPVGYFPAQPAGTVERDGYWVHEMAEPRERWLELLAELAVHYPGEFDYFFRAGSAGISLMTNLPDDAALAANQREYSEPVQWLGEPAREAQFVDALRQRGASVLRGGRFLSVSGDCDKGRALTWLRQVYCASHPGVTCHDLAIGDSRNDCAMLEAAETALVVRSPVHGYPPLAREHGVAYSRDYGPAGWAEGVERWLQSFHKIQ